VRALEGKFFWPIVSILETVFDYRLNPPGEYGVVSSEKTDKALSTYITRQLDKDTRTCPIAPAGPGDVILVYGNNGAQVTRMIPGAVFILDK
jgi:hypothetical protein